MRLSTVTLLTLVVILIAVGPDVGAAEHPQQSLAFAVRQAKVGPANRRLLLVCRSAKGEFVVCDGQPRDVYDEVVDDSITFSADGKRYGYIAKSNDKFVVVIDGEESPEYDSAWRPQFTPDARRVAYVARAGEKAFVVVDGKRGPPCAKIGDLRLSRAGRVAYIEGLQGPDALKWRVRLDGKPQKVYDSVQLIPGLLFSPDGRRLAYVANAYTSDERYGRHKAYVCIDGREQGPYSGATRMAFSPDSERFAYVARTGGWHSVVLDGKVATDKMVSIGRSLVFSPDSQRFAYVMCGLKGKYRVAVDGKKGKPFEKVFSSTLVFSPGSKRLAYLAGNEKHSFLVIDGKEQKQKGHVPELWMNAPMFGPKGRRIAYALPKGGPAMGAPSDVFRVVIDSKASRIWLGQLGDGMPEFNPDGSTVAYVVRHPAGSEVVVTDGSESDGYSEVRWGSSLFDTSGQHVVYIAREFDQDFVVVDGKPRRKYDAIIVGENGLAFDGPDTFHYFARDDGRFFRVTEKLP